VLGRATTSFNCIKISSFSTAPSVDSRLPRSRMARGVILVPTAAHWEAFRPRLEAEGVDVAAAQACGQLTVVDADELLPQFMRDAMPDAPVFLGLAEEVISQARGDGLYPKVRWWGEMVNVLWERGNAAASMDLEDQFDRLAREQEIAIFCSFVMDNFNGEVHSRMLPRLGQNHSHLIPVEDYARLERARGRCASRDRWCGRGPHPRRTAAVAPFLAVPDAAVSGAAPFVARHPPARRRGSADAEPQTLPGCKGVSAVTVRSSAGHAQSDHRRGAQPDAANPDGAGVELSNVVDAVDVPIIVVDRDCQVVRFNHAAAETLGLTPLDVRRCPRDIEALAGAPELEKLCAQVIADASPCRREIRHGDRRFILRLAPYSASNGLIVGAVLTFTNVTAFRESIDQAIYEREYTKAILNTVIDPLVVLDSGLRVQTANRAFYSMFGASRDKTQGVQLRDLGDADWKASALWASLGAIVADAGEFQPFEVEREFPALGRRSVLVDARRVARDGEANILLTLHDVTDRKKAEEDLRRGQEELVDFVENASVGMHWIGPDGIIQWANRTELELLGYAREEFIGRHVAEFHVEAAAIEDILYRLKSGEAVHDYGARLRCKDGSIRDVLINSNVLWEGNEFIHTRCFTRDITERKRAEEALRENEARFRALFESMDEGYCVVELLFDAKNTALDYRYLEINPAFEKQTGIVNAKGRLMREIAPQHEQQWFDAYGSVALTGETTRFESAAAAFGALLRCLRLPRGRSGVAPRRHRVQRHYRAQKGGGSRATQSERSLGG